MGWVMTPSHGNEPARSPPHVAMQLEKVYEIYLEKFESWYQQILARNQAQRQQNQQQAQAAMQPHVQQSNAQMNALNLQQNNIAALSSMSAEKLREAGHTEQVIQVIEARKGAMVQQQQQKQQHHHQQAQQGQQPLPMPPHLTGQHMQAHTQQQQQQPDVQLGAMQGLTPQQIMQAKMASVGMQPNMASMARPQQFSLQRGPNDPPLTKPTPEQLRTSQLLVQRWREEAMAKTSEPTRILLQLNLLP